MWLAFSPSSKAELILVSSYSFSSPNSCSFKTSTTKKGKEWKINDYDENEFCLSLIKTVPGFPEPAGLKGRLMGLYECGSCYLHQKSSL